MENQIPELNNQPKVKKLLLKSPKFPRLFSSSSRYLLPLVLLLIVLSSSGFYYYQKQKSSADLNVRDILSSLRGQILYAAACHDNPNLVCDAVLDDRNYIYTYIGPLLLVSDFFDTYPFDACRAEFIKKYPRPSALPPTKDIVLDNCTMTISKKNNGTFSVILSKEILGSPKDKYNSLFTQPSSQRDETIHLKYFAKYMKYYDLEFWDWNNYWFFTELDNHGLTEFSGGAEANYSLALDGTQNLIPYLNQWVKNNPDFEIDPNSSWQAKTKGRVFGKFSGTWNQKSGSSREFQYSVLDFCPNDCKISIEEEMNVKLHKKGLSDGISGDIANVSRHKEDFIGKGRGDPKTGGLFWQELKINKEDDRNWQQNMIFHNNLSTTYTGQVNSIGEIYPLTNQSKINTEINKSLSLVEKMGAGRRTGEIMVDKVENNDNGNLSRTGTGNLHAENQNLPFATSLIFGVPIGTTTSGIFDNVDEKMLITSSANGREGERIEPFEAVSLIYTQSYIPENLTVPGFFTANSDNSTTTVLSTRKVKTVPKYVHFIHTYKNGDKAYPPEVLNKLQQLKDSLTKQGATVITDYAGNARDLKSIFALIQNNSWVVIIGHGTPNGLSAGKDFVNYQDLVDLIKLLGIKIDVFGGSTCYIGRAPLGEQIVGSLGVSLGTTSEGGLGTLFGIGPDAWTYSSNDVFNILANMAGCPISN